MLEIGCGAGELLAQVQAARKVGVDLSPKQIAAARARLPAAEFHVQAGETLGLTVENLLPTDTLWFYELVMTADDFTQ